jgi:protein-S-isoprenylcysteine O-methyltransferase Ste14
MQPRPAPTPVFRHVISILLLPFVVVVVVPALLLRTTPAGWAVPTHALAARTVGALVFMAGLALFTWCVVLFARVGRGTLAPWDPTQRLVAAGPYRYTRNPMISAVALMLTGEALVFGSIRLGAWTVLFIAANHVYFIVSEEPGLERRFGHAYVDYKRRVPRWLPRVR